MINKILKNYHQHEFLKADGFDNAIIGVDENSMRLIYSYTKCIDILMKKMTKEDAIEYFYYNIFNAYIGDQTPIWCIDDFN